jgi:hypothetical protein
MKFIFSTLGAVAAWGIYRYAPAVFTALVGMNGFSTSVAAIAALLTAVWGINLTRLSVFEKLDDLTADQKAMIILRAGAYRRKIVFSMVSNTVLLVVFIVSVNLIAVPDLQPSMTPLIGYIIAITLGYWLGGFSESWLCWMAIDESRIALAAAQSMNKQRLKYLEKMRDDEAKSPVSKTDLHMNGYTEEYKAASPG